MQAADCVHAAAEHAVDYPANYRAWQHVKTGIIQPGHPLYAQFGGIHHIYANGAAMDGLRTGEYPKGAGFVFDLLSYREADNTILEGERRRLDVMQFDAERYAASGGWGFESFNTNSTTIVEQNTNAACFDCHRSAAASKYVFSRYRE